MKLLNLICMHCLQTMFSSCSRRSLPGDFMLECAAFVRLIITPTHSCSNHLAHHEHVMKAEYLLCVWAAIIIQYVCLKITKN